MPYHLLADLVVGVHALFVCFVVAGGLLVLRWPWVAAAHLPAAVWGALIELRGGVCPLTPLENSLRASAGQAGYEGGFIEHYITAAIYPTGLTREIQLILGCLVLAINIAVYAIWFRRRQVRRGTRTG